MKTQFLGMKSDSLAENDGSHCVNALVESHTTLNTLNDVIKVRIMNTKTHFVDVEYEPNEICNNIYYIR